MKPGEIKKECDLMQDQIEQSQNRLIELRKLCKHQNTFKGLYSYRFGVIQNALLCCYCKDVIRFIDTGIKD